MTPHNITGFDFHTMSLVRAHSAEAYGTCGQVTRGPSTSLLYTDGQRKYALQSLDDMCKEKTVETKEFLGKKWKLSESSALRNWMKKGLNHR